MSSPFLIAAQYLREYFDSHRLPIEDLVSDQRTRGVCEGRQEALNVLFLMDIELQKTQGEKKA